MNDTQDQSKRPEAVVSGGSSPKERRWGRADVAAVIDFARQRRDDCTTLVTYVVLSAEGALPPLCSENK